MDILVIVGSCLTENSSANLCHCAYIKGLIDAGHTVDLLSMSEKGKNTDASIKLPPVNKHYTYYAMTLYERLSHKSNSSVVTLNGNTAAPVNGNVKKKKRKLINTHKLKAFIRKLYGIHQLDSAWYRKAKQFRSDKEYDLVVSIAYPNMSHFLARYLIEKKHIHCNRWVQIWEDPWCAEMNFEYNYEKIKKIEGKLLLSPDKIIYVSPLTLKYQKEIFPESASRMDWAPLPSYYASTPTSAQSSNSANKYGYFGDYDPAFRDLKPFYEAAKSAGITVNICGRPSNFFDSTDKITVYPRLPLDKLRPIENETNVLIFLCNLRGGQIPGKIYQYSATDKKILFILDGTEDEKKVIKEYFSRFNRYYFCENNKESIAKAINSIEKGECDDISNTPLDLFTPEKIARQLLDICME